MWVDPKILTGVLIRRDTQTHTGKRPCDNRNRDWSDMSSKRRNTKDRRSPSETRNEARKTPPRTSGRSSALLLLDFRLPASRTVREYMSFVLNHSAGGNLLRRPQKNNATVKGSAVLS